MALRLLHMRHRVCRSVGKTPCLAGEACAHLLFLHAPPSKPWTQLAFMSSHGLPARQSFAQQGLTHHAAAASQPLRVDPIPILSRSYMCTVLLQVRLASVAENSFNAVERIDEIAHIDQEDRDDIPGSRPDNWPSSGKARIHSYICVQVYIHLHVLLPHTGTDVSATCVRCGHA